MKRFALFFSLAGVLLAQTPAKKPSDQVEATRKFLGIGLPPDPAAVARGKQNFVATCGFCHGAKANGGEGGPDLIRSVLVLHDENGDQIGPVIHAGRPGKGMPSFASMTAAQISDIAAFLKSSYQGAANRASYQIQNLVTGDAKAGEVYFNASCKSCHSPTGDLAGIAARHTSEELQAAFLYPRRAQKRARETVTVTLPSGQTFSGVLDRLDDFTVALTDASGAHHSWPLGDETGTKVDVQDPLSGHLKLLRQYTNSDMHNILSYLVTLK
jgi:cytochrome c oxidase cbb3-type subunit III